MNNRHFKNRLSVGLPFSRGLTLPASQGDSVRMPPLRVSRRGFPSFARRFQVHSPYGTPCFAQRNSLCNPKLPTSRTLRGPKSQDLDLDQAFSLRLEASGPTCGPQQHKTTSQQARGSSCGARGIRTPDLFHAMEARYQLRHSPVLICCLHLATR